MRILLVLALGCSGPQATKPPPVQRTTSDNTCEHVTWSCVAMQRGTEQPSRCIEGNEAQAAQYQASCAADGRFALGACMRDNLVGGCTRARGDQCTTSWYYPPSTRGTVEDDCEKQDALFAAP